MGKIEYFMSDIVNPDELRQRLSDLTKGSDGDGSDSNTRSQVLAHLKDASKTGRGKIEAMLMVDGSGMACANRLSILQDEIIRCVYDFAIAHVFRVPNLSVGERMAIVATGGYGRGTLAPGSDLDLLFLLPYKQTALGESIVEYMLYMLWDMGYKVGHAARSVDQCISLSKGDMTIRTSVLESRYIWGERQLFDQLLEQFDKEIVTKTAREFIAAKLDERDVRHTKSGQSRYLVEPNVKDGKGGLRDLHTLFWISKYYYRVRDQAELISTKVFSKTEFRKFNKAQDFLWAVRCHLHFLTGRAEERLSFDIQPALAERLGYLPHPGQSAVERFMKHYFLVAKDVGNLTRILCSALAGRAMVFDNAWVSNPVCMPNRSTMMTGRMPTAHGVIFNDRSLDWHANTFVRSLKRSGYATSLIGKSHLQHGMSRNAVVPFRGEAAAAPYFSPGWDQLEDFERFAGGVPTDDPDDFYGFEHVELAIDHGARATGHHLHWALSRGAASADVFTEYEADAPGSDRSERWWQIYRPPYDAEFHSTNFVTERTLAFLEGRRDDDVPWMVWCSFPDPHHPMTPPGAWFDRHAPADMPLPASRHDPLDDAPRHLKVFRDIHPRDQRNWVAPCGYGDDDLLREAIAATYGMVEMIDDGVGRILERLDAMGARDDTIVVFTSDHGDMMGDHGLFLKGFMHYRGTLQVPLVIASPAGAAGRTERLASSIDLAPTLLDLAGATAYDGIQGRSLAPLLDPDGGRDARDFVLIEDDIADVTARLTPIPGKTRTVIADGYKYTRNSKGEEQLFLLNEDPDEMRNLVGLDPAARSLMIERLADALIDADDAARGAPATGVAP